MHTSLSFVKSAIAASSDLGLLDDWDQHLAEVDSFVACTADAAKHLAKAVMGRHGLDARHSHDLHLLAKQAQRAGHETLAEDFIRMNGATRHDHNARYMGADADSLGHALARLPVVLDLMRKELIGVPKSFLDPEQAGRLTNSAARIFLNGAASLREAMERDGTDMQPPEVCAWIAPLIHSRETLASRLDEAAEALSDGGNRAGKDDSQPSKTA